MKTPFFSLMEQILELNIPTFCMQICSYVQNKYTQINHYQPKLNSQLQLSANFNIHLSETNRLDLSWSCVDQNQKCLLLKTKHEFVFIYATKKAVLMGIWKRFEGARLLSPHVLCAGNTQRTCVIEIDQSEQGGLPVTHQNQSPSPPKTVAP